MSQTFDDLMDQASLTSDLMEVDTAFLNAYRRGGAEELQREQAREAERQQSKGTGTTEGVDGPDYDDPEHTSETGDKADPAHGRRGGGSGTSSEKTSGAPLENAATAEQPRPNDEAGPNAVLETEVAAACAQERAETPPPVPLQFTDHQEAVQAAAATTTRGGSSGSNSDDETALPTSGFRIGGVKSQPHIKALPETIMNVLREQLRSAAVRELGVGDHAAREFSERLSQGTLVTAFLLAQLDLCLDADATTLRAVQLFRSLDPLLGSVASRMEELEKLERTQGELLRKVQRELDEVRQTSAVIEHAVAYSIADRSENFLRGSHNIHDAPLGHKNAVFVRDRAREATKKQHKLEKERDGRPIR